ncbi:nucleotidyltransferase family protein [Methylogaea oryzae]|uniref:Polymerase beta nucleotidyltransferase domain-containing protein n=1 Tax=Methylogaea oryzae TaxID=1295382 RepID=A0A8D4VN39_9GAMM|nr:nucleotidyltransferase domain-containing protein [Methylogaea oryzae]BBL70269.1 hypothetical protein MoryE10_08750 [Methylogaea oryzae]
MRLSETERQAIRSAVAARDPVATVFLFGSRADDAAKGGDIDLLVLSRSIDLMAKLDILGELHSRLGERRIDLAVYPDLSAPFARIARQNGVPL